MDVILIPILKAIISILNFYQLVIFINVIFSWVFMLGIADPYRPGILSNLFMFTRAATEPVYALVRRVIPTFGPMDFSPVVVILAIYIISEMLQRLILKINAISLY